MDSLLVIDNSPMSAISNTLALVCSLPFPFFSALFLPPDEFDDFLNFCPLPLFGRFPPGQ